MGKTHKTRKMEIFTQNQFRQNQLGFGVSLK